ncbi:MAG: pyridoxamine 5'-phosphate oxidase family protein [Hyphomicrobiales bacterium]
MTRAEREKFLAGLHVGVLSMANGARGPVAVPLWYGYEPGGDIHITTGESAKKVELLRAAGRATLVAQNERPPYAYVSVEGPVSIEEPDYERDIRALAIRYLGEAGGEAYLRSGQGAAAPGTVLIRIRPEHWNTADFSKAQ